LHDLDGLQKDEPDEQPIGAQTGLLSQR
jgi:hypothetical protein